MAFKIIATRKLKGGKIRTRSLKSTRGKRRIIVVNSKKEAQFLRRKARRLFSKEPRGRKVRLSVVKI